MKALTEAGSTEYVRWQNIKRGRARMGANEIEILGRVYPQYRWWLITGEVKPDQGQSSPEHDGLIARPPRPSAAFHLPRPVPTLCGAGPSLS